MNKIEIDHIGAYLCGRGLSELLLCHYNDEIGRENCEILCFKVSEKWRLFCFVLFWLGLGDFSHFSVILCFTNVYCKVLCSKTGEIVKKNDENDENDEIDEIVKKNDERPSALALAKHSSVTSIRPNLLILILIYSLGDSNQ